MKNRNIGCLSVITCLITALLCGCSPQLTAETNTYETDEAEELSVDVVDTTAPKGTFENFFIATDSSIKLDAFGLKALDFMSMPSAFRTISIASNIWQDAGFSSILFIATLAGIDPALYEAAELDGASIWQKIRYIDIPTLIPTAMMVLIMNCGSLFASNASKVLLLQTPGNVTVSEIIGTYVHNVGLGKGMFSYTTAIGLFTNVINFIMIITVNKISKKTANVDMF